MGFPQGILKRASQCKVYRLTLSYLRVTLFYLRVTLFDLRRALAGLRRALVGLRRALFYLRGALFGLRRALVYLRRALVYLRHALVYLRRALFDLRAALSWVARVSSPVAVFARVASGGRQSLYYNDAATCVLFPFAHVGEQWMRARWASVGEAAR